ncbi:GTP-binding rho2 [Paramuricea clavata]|uniref:GTP-binding rho2 n=1 Tax=Paramuricea clavata TaxID=317549 RepID=A0A6S7HR34_PARCT|nr:GTP-binding rho2 [Paramuricea clavata]
MCLYCEFVSSYSAAADRTAFYQEHAGRIDESRQISYLDLYFVGDVSCGKTSLVKAMKMKACPYPVQSSEFREHVHYKYHLFHEEPCLVISRLIDDRRMEDVKTRRIWYTGLCSFTAVIVLCYSIDSCESFNNVKKWLTEIREHCGRNIKDIRIILLGLKTDLRFEEKAGEFVFHKEGKKMAKKIGASCYIECSTVSGEGIDEVFKKAYEMISEVRSKGRLCRMLKFCMPF